MIDRDGELLVSMRSPQHETHAARRFLRRLVAVTSRKPWRVTTDKDPTYHKVIYWILGWKVSRWRCRYLNNLTEPDHRGVKQRSHPMLGLPRF